MRILIIGNGYIGGRCAETWLDTIISDKFVTSIDDVSFLIERHKPDVVFNAAGVVGKPNVDWCETHQEETIDGNTILPLTIAKACQQKGLYMLHIGTGCIFYGPSPHGGPWREDDPANPVAVYSKAKYAADLALSSLDNVGIVRIRMPLDDRPHPANIVDKLSTYSKVVDVENSLTVVPDVIDVFYKLLKKRGVGIFHATNPGSIKHRIILELYRKYVDPSHQTEWISEEDLVKQGLADKKRSNNIMSSINLEKIDIHMRPVKEAVENVMIKYAKYK